MMVKVRSAPLPDFRYSRKEDLLKYTLLSSCTSLNPFLDFSCFVSAIVSLNESFSCAGQGVSTVCSVSDPFMPIDSMC